MESKNGEIDEIYKIEKWDPKTGIYENPKITNRKSRNGEIAKTGIVEIGKPKSRKVKK